MIAWSQGAEKFQERIKYAEHTRTSVSEQEILGVTGERVYTDGHSQNGGRERLRNYVIRMSTGEQAWGQMCAE